MIIRIPAELRRPSAPRALTPRPPAAAKPRGAGGPLAGRLGPPKKKGRGKGRGPLNRPPCPPAFDCNGINPRYWHPTDGVMDEYW